MPFSEATLKKESKQFLVMVGTHSLREALNQLAKNNSQENKTYLIVLQSDNLISVAWFPEFRRIIAMLGAGALDQPLQVLPLHPASQIFTKNTRKSSREILDKVGSQEYETVVVVDNSEVLGLLTNPIRSPSKSSVLDSSLSELPGQLVNLVLDPRSEYHPSLNAPQCPHCNEHNFFRFNSSQRFYWCPTCNKEVSQL